MGSYLVTWAMMSTWANQANAVRDEEIESRGFLKSEHGICSGCAKAMIAAICDSGVIVSRELPKGS